MNYGRRFMTLYMRQEQDHPQGKEMQKGKMAVWGGLTNSCENKRHERQRRKGKIQILSILSYLLYLGSLQFSSVAQSCPTLCNPKNRSTPGLPIHHQLPEFTQTDIHRVSDAIQPSHPLLSPSPPAPNQIGRAHV